MLPSRVMCIQADNKENLKALMFPSVREIQWPPMDPFTEGQ